MPLSRVSISTAGSIMVDRFDRNEPEGTESGESLHWSKTSYLRLVYVDRDWRTRYAEDHTLPDGPPSSHEADLCFETLRACTDAVLVFDRSSFDLLFFNDAASKLLQIRDGKVNERLRQLLANAPSSGRKIVSLGDEDRFFDMSAVSFNWAGRHLCSVSLRDYSEIVREMQKLRVHSFVDELTGLYNRRGFLSTASHKLEQAKRDNQRLALLFADLDGLKSINDNLGHLAGDSAIRDFGTILVDCFRSSDIISRIGGDEFVILTTVSNADEAESIKTRLLQHVQQHNSHQQRQYNLVASVGVSILEPNVDSNLEHLIQRADNLMYKEKRRKKAESGVA